MSEKEKVSALEGLAVIGLSVGVFFYRMLVITHVWNLVAPTLGAQPLSTFWQAFALSSIHAALVRQEVYKRRSVHEIAAQLGETFGSLSFLWLITWLVFR